MLAFQNARLIDGTGIPPIDGATVLIEKGHFVAVGTETAIPCGATVIDLKGKTVIPGLSDAHTHIGGSSGLYHPAMSNRTQSYNFTEMRRDCLRWGVLTVRSCGQFTDQALAFREEVKQGTITRSPRVLVSSPMFQAKKGHPCYTVFLSNPDVEQNACVMVDDDVDIEAKIDHLAGTGIDFVKAVYGHINKMDYPNTVPRMSKAALKRIADASHAHGLKLAVHVDSPSELEDALECGADYIEHIIGAGEDETELSDELVQKVRERGVVIVPTMISIMRFDPLSTAKPVMEPLKKAVKQFYDAGVTLCVGCDSGIPFVKFGESVHDEMACLVEAGIAPMDVLAMATLGNARLFGMEESIGSIESGKEADLIVLDGDPLADIRNTRQIRMILKSGEIIFDHLLGV